MVDELSIYGIVMAKLIAFAEFEKKTKEIRERQEAIEKELLEAAPEDVRGFLEEEMIIVGLLQFSKSSRKIVFYRNYYEFKDLEDIKKKFLVLEKAWKGAVKIRVDEPERERVEVFFSVPNFNLF